MMWSLSAFCVKAVKNDRDWVCTVWVLVCMKIGSVHVRFILSFKPLCLLQSLLSVCPVCV